MIRLCQVTQRFPSPPPAGSLVALQGVNFRAAAGEFVCLLGPSGCGKSTLLNLVAGFLRPTAGQVLFDGRPVDRAGPDRGVVFQDPTLFPWLTVSENMAFGLRNRNLSGREIDRLTGKWLRLVGLEQQGDAYPHQLSGGMRQRAALGRVMVLEPKALLMDEPFSALDANARERLQDELLNIWMSRPRSVLFVTHNVEEAVYLADRVVIMGPPPDSLHGEIPIPLPRPRDRESRPLRALVKTLRNRLDRLPCCLGACRTQE
jgi:NitT/TauT family transport system ATP-binding protein